MNVRAATTIRGLVLAGSSPVENMTTPGSRQACDSGPLMLWIPVVPTAKR